MTKYINRLKRQAKKEKRIGITFSNSKHIDKSQATMTRNGEARVLVGVENQPSAEETLAVLAHEVGHVYTHNERYITHEEKVYQRFGFVSRPALWCEARASAWALRWLHKNGVTRGSEAFKTIRKHLFDAYLTYAHDSYASKHKREEVVTCIA